MKLTKRIGVRVIINPDHANDVHRTTRLISGKFAMAGGVMIDGNLYDSLIQAPARVASVSNDRRMALIEWPDLSTVGLWVEGEFLNRVK